MHEDRFEKQTQRERTRMLIHGSWRRVGAKIACAVACALMVGQLLLPSVTLAAELSEPAAQDAVAATAAPEPATVAEPAPAADPAPTADPVPMPTADPVSDSVSGPASASVAVDVPAATSTEGAGQPAAALKSAPATKKDPSAVAAPQADAIQTCGVTDVIGGEGGVKVNTTVVDHYYDCELPPAFTLNEGETQTFDLADAPEAMAGMLKAETRYYKADNATYTLVETTNAAESVVTLSVTPVEKHLRLTLTFTGGEVNSGSSYTLNLNGSEKVGSMLTYTGTDYEGDNIIVGDPDDIFNAYKPGGSVLINETRDDYYVRYSSSSEIILAAAENEGLESLNVNNVKTDYAPGEAPRATGMIPASDADKYEIAYECWEEMDGDDPAHLEPVAFWYSNDSKYTPDMKKIDHFEEGKFYMYSVELRLKNGNTIAEIYEVNVNGNWVSHTVKTIDGVFAPNAANMLCEQPIGEWQAIDLIEINGATTTFKAGDKPVFTAGTPGGSNAIFQCEYWLGSDGSDVNSEEFWDQHITNHIDAFKPGVTYRYGVYLKPARGFYFTPNTKLKINGVGYGYQVGAASEVDPDSGWIYTLWLVSDLSFTLETTPEPDPTPRPGQKPAATQDKVTTATKTVAKPVEPRAAADDLPATGDDAAATIAAVSIAGATLVAAGAAVAKRREQ